MDGKAGKLLFILGAGVDIPLGLPTANGLIPALAEFTAPEGQGHKIHQVLRDKLPYLRFSFDKFVDNAVNTFLEEQLTQPTVLTAYIDNLKEKFRDLSSEKVELFREIVSRIEQINEANKIPDDLAQRLSKLAFPDNERDITDENLIKLRGIQLTRTPQTVVEHILRESIRTHADDNDLERAFNSYLVNKIFGFETLLTKYFTGFYTKHEADIKNYLYMSWILWGYFRVKMAEVNDRQGRGFYDVLDTLPETTSILTFNYTNFFSARSRDRAHHFHGDCESYIRVDTRQFIGREDDRIKTALDADSISELIKQLEIDFSTGKYYMPSIIPPMSFKPVISVEYLEEWYKGGQEVGDADQIVIIGYSFNYTDEHFNDLLRKKAGGKKLVVINPELENLTKDVCHLMGKTETSLNAVEKAGFQGSAGNGLLFLKARAEEITTEKMKNILDIGSNHAHTRHHRQSVREVS